MEHGVSPITLTDDHLIILVIVSERQAQRFPNPEDYLKMIRHVAEHQYDKNVTFESFMSHYNELIEMGLIIEPRRYMPQGVMTLKGFDLLTKIQQTEQFAVLVAHIKPGPYPIFDPLSDCT